LRGASAETWASMACVAGDWPMKLAVSDKDYRFQSMNRDFS
jgi:hypothetical protein